MEWFIGGGWNCNGILLAEEIGHVHVYYLLDEDFHTFLYVLAESLL